MTPQIKHQVKEYVVSLSSVPSREEIVSHLLENGVDMSMIPTKKEIDDIFDRDENKPVIDYNRTRQKYTSEQVEILESKYKQNPFPTREERNHIAKLLGIQTAKEDISNWFYLKRRRSPNYNDSIVFPKKLPKEQREKIVQFYERYGNEEPTREQIEDFSKALGLTTIASSKFISCTPKSRTS